MQQLASLNHDGVSHIMLGATAYEHKIFVGPFARKFPEAKVWAVPDQWSFPVDLPSPLLGIDEAKSGGGDAKDSGGGGRWFREAGANKFVDADGEVLEGRAAWRASEREKKSAAAAARSRR